LKSAESRISTTRFCRRSRAGVFEQQSRPRRVFEVSAQQVRHAVPGRHPATPPSASDSLPWDVIFTPESTQTYEKNLDSYRYVISLLGLRSEQTMMVAASR
jgi:hypothetical protein